MSVFATNIQRKIKQRGWDLYQQTKSVKSVGIKTLINQFIKPFDAEAQAKKSSTNPNSKWFGMPVEEIIAKWESNRNSKAVKGLGLDDWINHVYNNTEFDTTAASEHLLNTCMQFDLFKSEYLDKNNIELVCREQWLQNDSGTIKGRFDALYTLQNKLLLIDWKTVEEIKTENKWQKLLGPLSDLDDCKMHHMTLQLWMYKYLLKHFYDIEINSCRIVQITPTTYNILKPSFQYDDRQIHECIEWALNNIKQNNA